MNTIVAHPLGGAGYVVRTPHSMIWCFTLREALELKQKLDIQDILKCQKTQGSDTPLAPSVPSAERT